ELMLESIQAALQQDVLRRLHVLYETFTRTRVHYILNFALRRRSSEDQHLATIHPHVQPGDPALRAQLCLSFPGAPVPQSATRLRLSDDAKLPAPAPLIRMEW
ncbi:hypothetical protein Vretimale_8177, partial [Volvox reticuliferus]